KIATVRYWRRNVDISAAMLVMGLWDRQHGGGAYLVAVAPSYHRLGEVPAKRHVAFRAPNGDLYSEEVIGTEGFSGRYSIQYHRYAPTRVLKVAEADPIPAPPAPAADATL